MVRALATLALLVLLSPHAAAQRRQVDDLGAHGRTFRDCAGCPEMVVVPAGSFMMGSPESEIGRGSNEGPQHKVTMPSFAIGKYEVTFAQWDACAAEGGCTQKPADETWGRGRRPVINVSWADAGEFVAWLSRKTGKPYRLPTEAEWEYSARGITDASAPHPPFATGSTINYRQANYDANFVYADGKMGLFRQKTVEVGTFKANAFGLYDMHGNVWEWVQDCYKPDYRGAPADGSAVSSSDCKLRILRGGAWNYYPWTLRSAYRYATPGDVRLNNVGLRVARSL
jgi:formylglycine-generating enzyme required for sulfatase activity